MLRLNDLFVCTMVKAFCLSLFVISFSDSQSAVAEDKRVINRSRQINFKQEPASRAVRQIAGWIIHSGDNHRMPFVIIDKLDAKVFVFDRSGQLQGAAPVLVGAARGDSSVPGIGDRKLSSIRPEERTTPAGRFLSSLGRNIQGKEIVWVDYNSGVSMHPVITANTRERRLQRLATPTPLDNRISYGCINVPLSFYKNVVRRAFSGSNGIVYVLPETRTLQDVFEVYDLKESDEP